MLVLDVDGTLCHLLSDGETYADARPVLEVVTRLREYKADGWHVVLHTSRRMRSLEGNLGLITAHVVPELTRWLERHDVPFDELHVGKPWAGHDGFYVDDRAVRPDEFVSLSTDELRRLTGTS